LPLRRLYARRSRKVHVGVMPPKPSLSFDHTVIHIADWDRSNTFYRDVLGAELIRNPEAKENPVGGWTYRFGTQQLNVHGPWPDQGEPCCPPPLNLPGGADICFSWPASIESAVEHLGRLGVAVVDGPRERFGARGPGTSVRAAI
jgi:catechol 2,3-dioxygenase-like lactoylglutathione lyase family enzyme